MDFYNPRQAIVNRGKVLFYSPSVHDPYGCVVVECAKHGKQIKVTHTLDAHILYEDTVSEAFDKCPDCLNEQAAKESHWPEGAEL